ARVIAAAKVHRRGQSVVRPDDDTVVETAADDGPSKDLEAGDRRAADRAGRSTPEEVQVGGHPARSEREIEYQGIGVGASVIGRPQAVAHDERVVPGATVD